MNWVSAGDRRVPVGVLRVHLRRPRREHYCLHREEGHQTQSISRKISRLLWHIQSVQKM